MAMKNEEVKAAIKRVIQTLRTGDIEKIAYAVFKAETGRPSDSWSFLNRLMMFCSETEDARGIRQWNRAGRRLKKDTKALYIRVPAMVKTGAKRTNEEGEEEEQTRRVYKHIPVYRVEDTHDKMHGRLKGGQQPDQEIVAELAAEVVGYLLGHKLNGKGRDYIESYSGGSWKPVFALLDRVQKVVSYIVDKAQIKEGAAPPHISAHVGISGGVPATA
jgi:hypothetical protein